VSVHPQNGLCLGAVCSQLVDNAVDVVVVFGRVATVFTEDNVARVTHTMSTVVVVV